MQKMLSAIGIVAVLGLTGCPDPSPAQSQNDVLNAANAYTGDTSGAQMISEDEFRSRFASGQLTLVSDATIAAQKQATEQQYQADKAFLQSIPNPSPAIQALLIQAAAFPNVEGDRPAKLADGQTVLLLGMGAQLRNAVETYKRSQSVDNALGDYALRYSMLSDNLKPKVVTPESLKGKPLSDVQAAFEALEAVLKTPEGAASLPQARLENWVHPYSNSSGVRSQEVPVRGIGGKDNDGPCTPKHYAFTFWFPLREFISEVKDQAGRGLCWAFAAIGAVESREKVQNDSDVNLSEQFLANKVKQHWDPADFADGYWAESALAAAEFLSQPLPYESYWYYNSSSSRSKLTNGTFTQSCIDYSGSCSDTTHQSPFVCTVLPKFLGSGPVCGYATMDFKGPGVASSKTIQIWASGQKFDLESMKSYLTQGWTIMASFPVYKGFKNDVTSDGVVSNYKQTSFDDKGNEVSGTNAAHELLIVGFLSNNDLSKVMSKPNIGGGGYFIIKNSWGCTAGDSGFYYVPADYVSSIFTSLSVLDFDSRRGSKWQQEQASPGIRTPPTLTLSTTLARANLRVPVNLAQFFTIDHPTANAINLTISSGSSVLYSGNYILRSTFGSIPANIPYTFTSVGKQILTLTTAYNTFVKSTFLNVDVVKAPPSIGLSGSGTPHQFDHYSLFAAISAPSEPDPTKLCTTGKWSVVAPDTVSFNGCIATVAFNQTGSRTVRFSTTDSDGASQQVTQTFTVEAALANPYPKITQSGLYCGNYLVGNNTTINIKSGTAYGCSLGLYTASLTVQNPSGETLSYSWSLLVRDSNGLMKIIARGTNNAFPINARGNSGEVTTDCRIEVDVIAPERARSKRGWVVWNGTCIYATGSVN